VAERTALAPSALPRPLSAFVGRRSEIEELKRVLSEARLVTLTGPGGCGKTRLAIEVASQVSDRYAGGVAFVDLAPVRDADTVPETVAGALGLSRQAWSETAGLIGETSMLLMLDNAEHLVDSVSRLVGEFLAGCPNLSILVTSRERLNITGEVSWRVPPLRLPPAHPLPPLEELTGYDAIRLFRTRAAEHEPSFRLTPSNAGLVVTVCRRLDGIPLALELAAARVGSLGLAEVGTRLNNSFRLLTGGSRTALDRHQTLRAAVDWSYSLLDEPERCLLRRLSVFSGSFDIEAVDAICPDSALPVEDVADVLHRLVNKSLVMVDPRPDGSVRYRVIEVIRQYGQERMVEADEAAFRAPHARYYGTLVQLQGSGDIRARVERLTAEYDNVRLALEWAAEGDSDLEVAMISALDWFWRQRGSVREACRWIQSALAAEHSSPALGATLHASASYWFRLTGDLEAAGTQINEAVRLVEQIDDPPLHARILRRRGVLSALTGDLAAAEPDLSRGLQMIEDFPPCEDLMGALNDLAMLALETGHPQEALMKMEQALRVWAQIPERVYGFPSVSHTHGVILLTLKRVSEARDRFIEGLADAAADENHQGAIALLQGLACCAAESGQAELCLELLAAARSFVLITGINESVAPGTPATAAEQRSRSVLSDQAAHGAWQRGLRIDLQGAVEWARARAGGDADSPVTPRKMEIVRLVALGLPNKEIARRLSISERTVEAHLEQLRNQLGFRNRAQIAAWAASHGAPAVNFDDQHQPVRTATSWS
jgi:non-specific serine/threonine protein kinase